MTPPTGTPEVRKAWAIKQRHRGVGSYPPSLLGVGLWGWPRVADTHMQGCTIALFATRKAARTAKAELYYAALSRVVRVTITIKEVPDVR